MKRSSSVHFRIKCHDIRMIKVLPIPSCVILVIPLNYCFLLLNMLYTKPFWSSVHLLVSGLCFKMSGALVLLLPLHQWQWARCLGRCLQHTMEMSTVGQITLSWALGVGCTFALSKYEVSCIVCSLGESWVSVIHLAFAVGCLHAWLVATIPLRQAVFCLTA